MPKQGKQGQIVPYFARKNEFQRLNRVADKPNIAWLEILFNYIIEKDIFKIRTKKEVNYEKNLSTQEKTEKQSSRVQKENGDYRRQKNFEKKKKQGQKEAYGLTREIP